MSSVKAGWGIVIEDGTKYGRPNGIAQLMSQLANVMREKNIDSFSSWPNDDVPNLQVGVPLFARHMVIQGLHKYCTTNCPNIIVGAVQFLQEGGMAMDGFEYVPMTNDEMVRAIHGTFKANSKFVFISVSLHNTMLNFSNAVTEEKQKTPINELGQGKEHSDGSNVIFSDLAKEKAIQSKNTETKIMAKRANDQLFGDEEDSDGSNVILSDLVKKKTPQSNNKQQSTQPKRRAKRAAMQKAEQNKVWITKRNQY